MVKRSWLFVWVCSLALLVSGGGVADEPSVTLERGDALLKEGKPLDALKVYQGLLSESQLGGQAGGKALRQAADCLRRLGRPWEFDALCRKALEDRPQDWAFVAEASGVLRRLPAYGHVRGGQFYRGDHRNGGTWVHVKESDRRFWLKELWRRNPGKVSSEHASYYVSLARLLLRDRGGRWQFWRLQLLTDLKAALDWTRPDEELETSDTIPLDHDGSVLFFRSPGTWESAASDGERYLWALEQARRCKTDRGLERTHAQLCQNIYGVQSEPMSGEGPARRLWEQLPSLSDDETVVRLGSVHARVRVPDLWNALVVYKALDSHADLARIYEGRRQYDKALEHWRACKDEDRIRQITENWCQFGPAELQVAGRQAELSLTYRNAESASFTAYDFDYERFMEDSLAAFLKDGQEGSFWRRYHELGLPTVGSEEEVRHVRGYVRGEVASWRLPLSPRPGHLDTVTRVSAPISRAGSYWVTCQVPGGKACHVLVFLRDRMIVSSPRVKGHAWQVVEAASGAPVPSVQLEFLAYERVWEHRAGRSSARLLHKRFAEVSDGDGMVVIPEERLEVGEGGGRHSLSMVLPMVKSREGRLLLSDSSGIGRMCPMSGKVSRARMFFMCDRPLYRPGHTVRYSFWTGTGGYGKVSEPSAWSGRQGTLTISSSRGKKLLEETRKLDALGGLSGELPLAADADLGRYSVSFRIPGQLHGHGAFRVEAYRKPEYQVSLELPQEAPLLGDSFAVKVRADYYFGAPVTEGTVNLKIIRQSYCDRWYPLGAWDWLYGRGYGWLCGASPWYRGWHGWGGTVGMEHWFPFRGDRPEVVLSTQGVLGEDGRFAVTLDTSRVKELLGDRDHEYRITAEVRDASRRTVLGEGKVIVARKPFQSLVWLDRGYGKVGEPMTACLQARSLGGAPVTGKGRLTLYRVSYDGNGEPVETPERSWEADADSRGQGRQAFSASRAGQYRLSWAVTDGRGRTVEGGVLFSIVGDGYDGRDFRFNALELVPDKETYAPGDVARLLVNTELSGATVMLHIQGRNEGQPNEVQVLRMKGKSRVVEIPIRQEDKPNLHVTAYSIQNGQCHQVARSLPVPPESRILQVDVESDKKAYEPGDKGQLRLRVKDMGGKPVTGRLVVTVYDKSVDGLAGSGQIGDIREHFWEWTRPGNFHVDFLLDRFAFHNMVEPGQEGMWLQAPGYGGVRGRGGQLRSLGMTKSMAPMAAAAPRVANVAKADMQVAEAEGAAAMDEAGAAPEAVAVRTEFADTALWAADVTTDASGCATLPLALPENLTTWRIRVWSMASGTRVGEGQAEVIVSKRLLIRPQVPRFFRERDEMTVSGIVHNYSGRDAELTVSLVDSSGCLELLDAQRQRVKVGGKGGEARVDWRVKVARAGESVLRMVASDESRSLSDGVECRVPVLVHGLDILATKTGKMSGEDTVQEVVVSIPEAIAPGSCKVRIRMTSTLAGVMLDALPYLISPPDGTTDQVLSRFLPLVQTRLTLKRLGMNLSDLALKTHLARALSPQVLESLRPVYDQQALERLVRKGLDALASMQCADGGWGWFSGWGEVSTPHMTSQVVYGLLLARENGLGVPEGTLRRGLAWLKEMQTSRVKALAEHPGWRTQDVDALVYRVLCKGGERSMAMSDLLFRDRGVLSLRGLILYGLGLKETQSESTLNEILTILMQYVRRDSENGTAWLERGDDWAWWCWNYDEIETLAHFLQLLVHREPRGRLASEIAVYLVHNRRHGSYWRSTRDTAACIEAMSEYLLASGEANADIAVKLCMDGRVLTSFTTSQGAVRTGEVELVLTGADISPGHHVLRFEKTGRGVFYWGMVTSYFSYEEMIAPEGLELKVSRRVYLLTADDRMSAGADRHARAVAMRREGWKRRELRDGDRIRSGDLLEVELTVASKNDYEYLLLEDRKASGWEPVDQRSGYSWDALGAYVELRDESVKFYLRHLKRGIHALTYRVRAEQPGTFHVLPPTVRGVYAPELRGNGSEQRVIIGD